MMRTPPRNCDPVTPGADEAEDPTGRTRRDLASGDILPVEDLIRCVVGPDGTVVPDVFHKLPGRGLWVRADRDSLDLAIKKGLFSRAAKAKVTAPGDLADTVERILHRQCLSLLGLARREGLLISGFEKCQATIRSGRAAWLIEASDGASDGRKKLLGTASGVQPAPKICGAFTCEELSLSLGLGNVIHLVLLAGRRVERWTTEVNRLAGFRPLLPMSWREETRDGRSL